MEGLGMNKPVTPMDYMGISSDHYGFVSTMT